MFFSFLHFFSPLFYFDDEYASPCSTTERLDLQILQVVSATSSSLRPHLTGSGFTHSYTRAQVKGELLAFRYVRFVPGLFYFFHSSFIVA